MSRKRLLSRFAALAPVLIVLGLLAWVGPVQAQEPPVNVRTGVHDEFERIVFEWRRLPQFEARQNGAEIIVRFARPLTIGNEALGRALNGALEGRIVRAVLAEDGQTVRIQLGAPAQLRSFPIANAAVVDLIGPGWGAKHKSDGSRPQANVTAGVEGRQAAPQPMPKPAGRRVDAAVERPGAKTASHDTAPRVPGKEEAAEPAPIARLALPVGARDFDAFSRLVFDWPVLVDYSVQRDRGAVTVRFPAGVSLDEDSLRAKLPRRFLGIEVNAAEAGLTLHFAIPETARLRHFQKGNRIVIDVLDAADIVTAARPAWATQADGTGSADEHHAGPVTSIRDPAVREARLDASSAAPIASTEPTAHTEPTVRAEPTTHAKPPTDAEAVPHAAPEPPAAPEPVPLVRHPAAALAAAADSAKQTANEPAALSRSEARPQGPPSLHITTEAFPDGVRLRFHWERRVGVAVFARDRVLWVVFDVPRAVPLERLSAARAISGLVVNAEQVAAPGATVLRFFLSRPLMPQVARSGDAWLVELSTAEAGPAVAQPLTVRREPDAHGGGRVVVSTGEAGRALWVDDPEVGDRLAIVPLVEPGRGMPETHRFVQFVLPSTTQGAVVVPRSDDLIVKAMLDGIHIASKGQLLLSSRDDLDAHTPVGDRLDGPRILYDFDQWRREDLGGFVDSRQVLQNSVIDTPSAARTGRRIALARLFLAYGYAADAIGVLQRVAAEDDEAEENPDFVSLRGATLVLLNRLDEAAGDLESPLLDDAEDIPLWRAIISANRGEWEEANSAFSISQPSYRRLPPNLKARFGLLAAHAALAVGNIHRAERIVTDVAKETTSVAVRSEARFIEASIAQRAGKIENALAILEELAVSAPRPVRARAALERIELQLRRGDITRREAIDRLESLRHAWRGDSFEQRLLRRLGELYREEQDYMNALQAMRDAVESFPNAPETPAIRESMERLFSELFLGGRADVLTPLAALGLFYEFGELSPSGAHGGRIAEGLARRLVDIDLLDQAARLLDEQIGELQGADKARTGARLAVVHLLNDRPETARQVLERTRVDGEVPDAIAAQRRHLGARALAALGHVDDALGLIEGDTDRNGALLRADLLWDASRWPALAAALDGLLETVSPDALDDAGRRLVLRQSIALTMQADREALDTLRARFMVAMAGQPHAEAFDFLTRSVAAGEVPFEELPRLVANIDGAEALRDSYLRVLEEQENAVN